MHSRASTVLCLALVFVLTVNNYLAVVAQTTPAEAPELSEVEGLEPSEVEGLEPSEVEALEPSEVEEAPASCQRNLDCEGGEFCFEGVCISFGGDDDGSYGGDDDESGGDD